MEKAASSSKKSSMMIVEHGVDKLNRLARRFDSMDSETRELFFAVLDARMEDHRRLHDLTFEPKGYVPCRLSLAENLWHSWPGTAV